MARWYKWQALSWAERGVILQSCLLLTLFNLTLVGLGLRRLQWLLVKITPLSSAAATQSTDETVLQAQYIARLVGNAAQYGPYRATCLRRSLVVWWLLRCRGIASELCLGIRNYNGVFESHAWVEYQGIVVNDQLDVRKQFAIFDSFSLGSVHQINEGRHP